MKKHPKLLQVDKRGQIVIPKEVRMELGIDETTGFYAYTIPGEGIFFKQITEQSIKPALDELERYAQQLGVDPKALKQTLEDYKKNGGLERL